MVIMPHLIGFDFSGHWGASQSIDFETDDELKNAITFLSEHQKLEIQWRELDPVFDDTSNPPWKQNS